MPSLRVLIQCILLTLAVCTNAHGAHGAKGHYSTAKAVYVMTNDVYVNSIVAMSVGYKGKLSGSSTITPTGGKGSNLVGSNGKPLFPDALSVQDSVVSTKARTGSHDSHSQYLFAVNAGSNTLSMFAVSPSNPLDVTLLGQPQYTQGVFPVSVAVSSILKIACVANQGIPSGVSCAKFSEQGLSNFDTLRAMSFGATQNPPLGPVPGVGDIFFTEDQTSLLVTVKGNNFANGTFAGFVGRFAVKKGGVAKVGTRTSPPGTAALFGTGLIPGSPNIVFASDAAIGAVTLNVEDLAGAPLAKVTVSGQIASCWAAVSDLTGTGFITDAGVNRLVEADVHSGKIVTEYYPPNPFSAMSDFRIVGGKLWSLSAGNGSEPASITTFDISGGPGTVKQVSTFAIPWAGVNTMGMAVIT